MLITTFGAARGDPRHCEVVHIGVIYHSIWPEEKFWATFSSSYLWTIIGSTCRFLLNNVHPPNITQPIRHLLWWYSICSRYDSWLKFLLETREIVRRRRWTCCHQYQVWVDTLRTGNASEDGNSSTVMTVHTLQVDAVAEEQLDKMLRSFWELKSLGLEPFYDITQDPACTVELKDGWYEFLLPWEELHGPLPDNYELSLKCDQGILNEYCAIIQEQLDKGIITIVEQTTGRAHYLPHHTVVWHNKETTKVRVVYNASAWEKSPSLNNKLLSVYLTQIQPKSLEI